MNKIIEISWGQLWLIVLIAVIVGVVATISFYKMGR